MYVYSQFYRSNYVTSSNNFITCKATNLVWQRRNILTVHLNNMYKFRYVQHVELLAESWICVSEQDKKTYEKFAVSVPFKLQH